MAHPECKKASVRAKDQPSRDLSSPAGIFLAKSASNIMWEHTHRMKGRGAAPSDGSSRKSEVIRGHERSLEVIGAAPPDGSSRKSDRRAHEKDCHHQDEDVER